MAYITKRGNKWQARVSWVDSQGKMHQKAKSGFPTKTAAKQFAYEWENRKTHNQISDKDPALADYFLDWYKTYKENKISISTQRMYLKIHKYLSIYFGKEKLSQIRRNQYQKFINEYGKQHAKVTVQKTQSSIHSCIHDAILDGIVTQDFTERIELVWDESRTLKVEYLSLKEIKELIASLNDGLLPRYTGRYMIITAINTGMRLGELLALTWSDIDSQAHTININKSYDYVGQRIKSPKTASSVRVIRVSKELIDLLFQLKANNQKFVFAEPNGKILTSSAVNHMLQRHLAKCDIVKRDFHFHSLRHSHVALLLSQGVDLYAISKRLGHADMSITAKTYAYLIDELKAKSDDKIEAIISELLAQNLYK